MEVDTARFPATILLLGAACQTTLLSSQATGGACKPTKESGCKLMAGSLQTRSWHLPRSEWHCKACTAKSGPVCVICFYSSCDLSCFTRAESCTHAENCLEHLSRSCCEEGETLSKRLALRTRARAPGSSMASWLSWRTCISSSRVRGIMAPTIQRRQRSLPRCRYLRMHSTPFATSQADSFSFQQYQTGMGICAYIWTLTCRQSVAC